MALEKISRYEIEKEIGRGAMGVVYLAYDPVIKRKIALKTIDLPNSLNEEKKRAITKSMLTEVRSAGRLNHPNIVTIYDYGEDVIPFVVMEYVEGESLEIIRKKKLRFNINEIHPIIDGVARAIDYAHSKDIIHRDIKPDNIILTKDMCPKVTDFGIAMMLDTSPTDDSAIIGSPSYMSPEQILGGTVDGTTDVFALGIVIYYLITGEKPFSGNTVHAVTYKILNEEPKPPSFYNPSLTMHVDGVLLKILSKNPKERYQKAQDAVDALVRAVTKKEDITSASPNEIGLHKRDFSSEISMVDAIIKDATTSMRKHLRHK
ncbi:MAG: serine/threonine protein kinase [Deltaproteobacteria bacterium]|nr:serine/threonine protein kinase [Deltaproteobacteria bacterium]